MLTITNSVQDELILNTLDELVPIDHLVRKLDLIDFTFIYEVVRPYYSTNNGRPSIDPIIIFKVIFIKDIFNINSIRQTIKEIEVNLAYRWFLKIPMSEKIPHFSIVSSTINNRFKDPKVIEDILQNIYLQASKLKIFNERFIKFKINKNKKQNINEIILYEFTLV